MTAFSSVFLWSLFFRVVVGFSEKLSGESILYGLASLTENYGKENFTTCTEELNVLYRAVEERYVWALKVLDASGQPESGFVYGNNLWLGVRSQCQDIPNRNPLQLNHEKVAHPPPTDFDYPPFPITYAKTFLKHNNTLQLHAQMAFDFIVQVGLCIPASCSNEELYNLFKEYTKKKYLNIQKLYDLNLTVEKVKSLEENPYFMFSSTNCIVLLVVLSITLVLTIIGTTHDVKRHYRNKAYLHSYQQNISHSREKTVSEIQLVQASQESLNTEESKIWEILRCFSFYSNVKNMMKVKLSEDSITCIHGIRFLGMLWICTIHAMFFQADFAKNVPFAFRIAEDFSSEILSNSTYSVDTYLFISGFLLAYLYYKSKKMVNGPVKLMEKANEFIMMCLHRIVRLTPVYMIVILLCDVIYSYLRRTSSLESSEEPDVVCVKYWWRNILYINNLFPRSEMCLSWSWYLSLDTQAFAISAILVIVSTFALKTATFLTFFFIISSMLITAFKSYSIGYIPTMDEQLKQLDQIYDLPWNRIGPYLVGVITGYILVNKLNGTLVLGKYLRTVLWIIFPLINLWIVFGLHGRQVTVEFSAVYMGISRTLWGVGIAWIVVACCTGNAVTANKFLSFRGWVPMSRLTFSAYLLNPLVANAMYMGADAPLSVSKTGFALNTMGVAFATFFWAFVVSVFFESPFIQLMKILLRRKVKKPTETQIPNSSGNP